MRSGCSSGKPGIGFISPCWRTSGGIEQDMCRSDAPSFFIARSISSIAAPPLLAAGGARLAGAGSGARAAGSGARAAGSGARGAGLSISSGAALLALSSAAAITMRMRVDAASTVQATGRGPRVYSKRVLPLASISPNASAGAHSSTIACSCCSVTIAVVERSPVGSRTTTALPLSRMMALALNLVRYPMYASMAATPHHIRRKRRASRRDARRRSGNRAGATRRARARARRRRCASSSRTSGR